MPAGGTRGGPKRDRARAFSQPTFYIRNSKQNNKPFIVTNQCHSASSFQIFISKFESILFLAKSERIEILVNEMKVIR